MAIFSDLKKKRKTFLRKEIDTREKLDKKGYAAIVYRPGSKSSTTVFLIGDGYSGDGTRVHHDNLDDIEMKQLLQKVKSVYGGNFIKFDCYWPVTNNKYYVFINTKAIRYTRYNPNNGSVFVALDSSDANGGTVGRMLAQPAINNSINIRSNMSKQQYMKLFSRFNQSDSLSSRLLDIK